MKKELRFLIVEDSAYDAELVTKELGKTGLVHSSKLVKSRAEYIKAIGEYKPDVILCDYKMPGFGAPEALKIKKEISLDIPFIIVSGTIGEELAVEMMKSGATDYVIKDNIFKLVPAVKRALKENEQRAERKKAEDALRASDALLQAAINIMPVGLWVINEEGKIVTSSAAAQRIWAGVKYVGIDQLGEYNGWRTDSGKLIEAHEWAGARALEKGETTIEEEVEIECFDGTHKIILDTAVPLRKSDGSIGGAITINQDITERKKAERSLQESEGRLVEIFKNDPSGILIVNKKTRIIYEVNDSALELIGLSRGDVVGKVCHRFLCPAEMDSCPVCDLGQVVDRSERVLLKPDGTRVPILKSVVPIKIKGENYLLESFIDITERKKAEEKIKAYNQQLNAYNQQVKASNQQLRATEQQLRASNQQLTASEQQLKAANQQLTASNQQLRATEQQLRASNQQLKVSEQKLMKSEEAFRFLAENANDGIFITLGNGVQAYANERAGEITGYSVAELLKTGIKDLVHPDELKKIMERFKKRLSGETVPSQYETVIIHKDRKSIPIELTAAKTVWYGQPADLVFIRDITKRKESEKELLKLSAAVKQSPSIAVITDTDANIEYVNPKFTELTGYSPEEVVGKNPRILKSGETSPEEYKQLWETIASGSDWRGEFRNKRKDDSLYWENAVISSIKDAKGNTTHYIKVAEDISERKQLENKLIESEERYRTLFETSNDGILIADIETRKFYYANPAICRMLGYSKEEIEKMNVADIHPKDRLDYVISEFEKQARGEITLAKDIPCLRKDGAIFFVDINTSPIILNNKNYNVGFFRDITDRKKTEEEKEKMRVQVLQLQKMEAIGALAGGVAHDFNNLLTAIKGYSQLLLNSFPKEDSRRADVEEIIDSSRKAASLTSQLLAFSRKQILETRVIDINTVLKDMGKMLKRLIGEDIELDAIYDPKLENVKADQGQIEQVIMNLVVNAHDAMPHGGRITIKTENITVDEEQSKMMPESKLGSYARISIEDTGTGMDKDTISHIFEPFFTTKATGKGTGLGLSVTYGIVIQHEGFINVYSEKGKGSIFRVYLPSIRAEVDKIEKKAAPSPELKGKNEKILLVEDEEGIRKFVIRLLGQNNYRVIEAGNVKQALDIFKEEKDNIDMVFTDMILPDSTGLHLVEQVKIMKPGIKVLISSGYMDDKSQLTVIREKGYKFIQKPYNISDLLQIIGETIKSS